MVRRFLPKMLFAILILLLFTTTALAQSKLRIDAARPLTADEFGLMATCSGTNYNVNPIPTSSWKTVTTKSLSGSGTITVCLETGGPDGATIWVRLRNTDTNEIVSPKVYYSFWPSTYTWQLSAGTYRIETSLDGSSSTTGWGSFYVQ